MHGSKVWESEGMKYCEEQVTQLWLVIIKNELELSYKKLDAFVPCNGVPAKTGPVYAI